MLSDSLDEQFGDWLEGLMSHRSPENIILRILQAKSPLTLESATFILEPVGLEMKRRLAEMLLKELGRVCKHVEFVSPRPPNHWLDIQFSAQEPVERRPLELTYGF